jgi:deoxyribonuclease V
MAATTTEVKFRILHSWDVRPVDAVALQRRLAEQIDTRTPLTRCNLIAGADVSYDRFSPRIYGGVVVLRMDDLSVVETQGVVRDASFPYVPGLLTFRETPVLLKAFAKLQKVPDVVVLDGHGLAHPRRMGYACHTGLWLDCPTVGCAKSKLVGEYKEPAQRPGSVAPLKFEGDIIGYVVRTKKRTKPVFVSVGHKIDLRSAVDLVLATCKNYRIPEPTRQARLLVNALRRGEVRGCTPL